MKPVRSTRIMVILVILAIALSVSFAVLLVRQEMERRRSGIEYQVYQIMTGIVDVYNSGGTIEPAYWPDLNGFGIYSATGASLYRFGTAPEALVNFESISPRGESGLEGSSMTIIRRTGAVMPMRTDNLNRRGMRQMMPPMDPTRMPGGRFVFIDIDVENLLREGRLVFIAVILLISVFVSIVAMVVFYSRKLAMYRDREQTTAHLVQLGEAARTLAHEIKNPLGVIRVQCATLRRTLPEERQKNIGVIEEETERLVLLTNRVRDFLHNSDGNPVVCEARYFLEQCRVRYPSRIVVNESDVIEASVLIDRERMVQVLDNLIVNALEASEGASSLPEIALSVVRNRVQFRVADRGAGVAPENRERLFEPFFTTKTRGSGIGLALARRFIEQAAGTLGYEERVGGGSVFVVSLPSADKGETH